MKIKEGDGMDIQEAREAFERRQAKALNVPYEGLKARFDENSRLFGARYNAGSINEKEWNLWLEAWQAKAQAVPEVAQRQGGYYIRDLRSQPGNCMKFWYQAGYGTKHKNFFWCATLKEAKEYKGDCDWFEIWHAPYIDSLVEYTVDFQLADRGVGLVDLKAKEPAND